MEKSKRKVQATEQEVLTDKIAEQLVSKIIIVGGKWCLRGQEDSPIEIMAKGDTGATGVQGEHGEQGYAGKDGVGSPGRQGTAGKNGLSVTGRAGKDGADGKCVYPEIKWDGTKLCIGDLPPIDLSGAVGKDGAAGLAGQAGKTGQGIPGEQGTPGIIPSEVLAMVNEIQDLRTAVNNLISLGDK